MAKGTPADEGIARDIIIAYIQSLGSGSSVLFRRPGQEQVVTQNFEETWDRILKTVSGQNSASE
jgi:hypothetical protein